MKQNKVIAKIKERQHAGMFKDGEIRIMYCTNIDMEIDGAKELVRILDCSRCGKQYESRSYIDEHTRFGGHLEFEGYSTSYHVAIGRENYCPACQEQFTKMVQGFVKPV